MKKVNAKSKKSNQKMSHKNIFLLEYKEIPELKKKYMKKLFETKVSA